MNNINNRSSNGSLSVGGPDPEYVAKALDNQGKERYTGLRRKAVGITYHT